MQKQLRVFSLKFSNSLDGFDNGIVDRFCRENTILDIKTEFVVHEKFPYCLVSVVYEEKSKQPKFLAPEKVEKEDVTATLNESEKLLYERLRVWRKQTADQAGIPAFMVCTNVQMKEIVVRRCHSIEAMQAIHGLGKSKLANNGKAILAIIEDFYGKNG